MVKIKNIVIWLITVFILHAFGEKAETINPFDLTCEYLKDPLGMDHPAPRLSWKLRSDARDQKQTAYRILVSDQPEVLNRNEGNIWDSRKVQSGQSIQTGYDGLRLESAKRYYWKVRVWDKNDRASAWSAPAYWETGLLETESWKAGWIGLKSDVVPYLRKTFRLSKTPREARVYISGLGYYELRLNGRKVGDHVLDPGQTDYEKRTFYTVYDVTGELVNGENVIGVILGDGWYNQSVVNTEKYGWKHVVYGKPKLICQLRITYEDESQDLILSDPSWKGSSGPIVSSNLYAGEKYDAGLEKKGWDLPGFDDRTWESAVPVDGPGGKLVWQNIPPVKVMQTITPKTITNPSPGVYVYDMGQNFAGWVRLKIKATKGTVIQLRFAEWLAPDGNIDPASTGIYATGVIPTDTYICKGEGTEYWEPRFTYHGFQYVEITGFPGIPGLETLEGKVVYSSLPKAGAFECSDNRFNQLHQMAWWTQVSNLHSIPTDCPNREKCGWLGDAFLTSDMVLYNFDAAAFWTKYLLDIETSRKNGLPSNITPGRRSGGISPDWGAAFIQIVWNLYLYCGDTTVIRKHYEGMTFFLNHLGSISNNHIVETGIGSIFPPGRIYPAETPQAFTSTALFYFCAEAMSQMAKVMGKTQDSNRHAELAQTIKTSFNKKFYDPVAKTYGGQEKNALALAFMLVPETDEKAVADNLNRDTEEIHHGHQKTGVFGSRYLHYVLGKYGYGKTVQKMLNLDSYPGYGYLISLGATTFWENWGEPAFEDRPGIAGNDRSKSHPFQGGFDAWFYQGIAGIHPDPQCPGFRHIIFRPLLTDVLTYAKADFTSVYGAISSKWENQSSGFIWSVSVPVNTTATIFLPTNGQQEILEHNQPIGKSSDIKILGTEDGFTRLRIGSGNYSFTVR